MIRKNTKTARMADHLLLTLYGRPLDECPTDSWELSKMIYETTGARYSQEELNNLAVWIRKNTNELGWNVPNMEPGSSTRRRWFVIVNGTQLGHDEVSAVEDGFRSNVRHAITRAENSLGILRIAIANAPRSRRWILRAAVDIGGLYVSTLENALGLWAEEEDDPEVLAG